MDQADIRGDISYWLSAAARQAWYCWYIASSALTVSPKD